MDAKPDLLLDVYIYYITKARATVQQQRNSEFLFTICRLIGKHCLNEAFAYGSLFESLRPSGRTFMQIISCLVLGVCESSSQNDYSWVLIQREADSFIQNNDYFEWRFLKYCSKVHEGLVRLMEYLYDNIDDISVVCAQSLVSILHMLLTCVPEYQYDLSDKWKKVITLLSYLIKDDNPQEALMFMYEMKLYDTGAV
jgi:hypothetical protein